MKNLHGHSNEMEKSQRTLTFDRHTHTFVHLLDYFRSKELYCDATIACDGKKYPVHQVVLSACSEFFAKIFATTNSQNPVVVLQDVNRSHLESLLTYIYRGEVNVPQVEFPDFVKVAKSLFIKGLMIPYSDEYPSPNPIHGTWHDSYYNSEEEAARLQAVAPNHRVNLHGRLPIPPRVSPRVPPRGEERAVRLPSYQDHIQMNSNSRIQENPRKRQHMMEPECLSAGYEGRHFMGPHYVMERPQDLRMPEQTRHGNTNGNFSSNNDSRLLNGQTMRKNQDPPRCTTENKPEEKKRSKTPETQEKLEDQRPNDTYYSFTDSRGTFQKLIAADETPIKVEPEDPPEVECDAKPMCGLEELEDSRDDDGDDLPLQISEDLSDIPDIPISDAGLSGYTEHSDDPKEYLATHTDHQYRPKTSTPSLQRIPSNSQLRRELLRPVTQTVGQIQQRPQNVPQSIPHPVIAPREPPPQAHPPLRDPPPLMKIQSAPITSDSNVKRAPRRLMKEMPVSRANSHLLVTAPPTYRTQNHPSNHLCFEIHTKDLGQVLVNGGPHISMPNPPFPQQQFQPLNNNEKDNVSKKNKHSRHISEGPLNLSGDQRESPEISEEPEAGNDDPFLGKIVTNRKKRLRGPKSWEFLVRLLKDPTTNPSLIRWESENNGIFRLVQPSVIAQRWGRRTGKHASECLTYENFARGLRYHYATGALKPVSEKSFVYRFGPKALRLLQECDSTAFPYI